MNYIKSEDHKHIEGSPVNTQNSTNICNEQKNNCIVKIILENRYATGFLLKIPFGNKNRLIPVLMTNYHVINGDFPKNNRYLVVCKADQNNIYNIDFNIPRRFYANKDLDFTIIEIMHEDNFGLKYFLEVDEDIEKEDPNSTYADKFAYTIHYPKGNEAILDKGKIKLITEYPECLIYHQCSTEHGSSGCPILNYETFKVIGIHKGADLVNNYNYGIFIKYPIKLFYEEMKKQKKDYYENYFDGTNNIDIFYQIQDNQKKLNLFGDDFVKNNIDNCKIIIDGHEYKLCNYINIEDFKHDDSKIFKIKLTGIRSITDMSYMFHSCNNLFSVSYLSQINTSKVISMRSLFEDCILLETLEGISDWDIKNVTNIRGFFFNCQSLNKISNITNWDTSNVIEMKDMFWSCSKLNPHDLPDISKWNKSKAKDSKDIFNGYEPGKNKNIQGFLSNFKNNLFKCK